MPAVEHERIATTLRDPATTARAGHFIVPYSFTKYEQPPLFTLIDNIYFIPLLWRKFIIDFCRIQRAIDSNVHLSASFNELVETTISYVTFVAQPQKVFVYSVDKDTLSSFLEHLLGSPTSMSMLSYFARAERTIFVDDFADARDQALIKEMNAATAAQSIPQRLDYSLFFKLPDRGVFGDGNACVELKGLLSKGLSDIRNLYHSSHSPVLLPAYNGRKNIAYSSQEDYLAYKREVQSERNDITTLDLLRLYRDTGYMVSGPMEIRMAWFYNDLKPRVYWCNGGDSYFRSLYIQDIANLICNILPSTSPATRFEVSRIGPVPDGAFLVTYDYTSFTSSLSELKYFLFWLAETFRGVMVDIYDPFRGVVSIDLGQYLHDYNDFANRNMAFSGERFAKFSERPIFHMGLAGALGIKGNIVFSTVLHGIALGDITGRPHFDCVVGDDALCYVMAHLYAIFVRFVNFLGTINPDKFSKVLRYQEDPNFSYAFKFLKRPLSLDSQNTPVLGMLDFFPDIASVLFPEGDGFHTTIPGTTHISRVNSFVRSLCRYSLLVSRYMADNAFDAVIYLEELERLRLCFCRVYEVLGLNPEGQMPGQIVRDRSLEGGWMIVDSFVPPMFTIDIFIHGWIEVVYWKYRSQEVEVPVCGRGLPPPLEVQEGVEFVASSDIKPLQVLVDLEYLHKVPLTHMAVFDDNYKERLKFLNMNPEESYEPVLATYTVTRDCISWYDLFSSYYTTSEGRDTLDIESVFSSIFE